MSLAVRSSHTKLIIGAIGALLFAFLAACGGGGGGDGSAAPVPTSVPQEPQFLSAEVFSAFVTSAPDDGATISGTVSFEVKGSNLVNVELLPAEGYAPKLAVFEISADGTTATATLDTTKLPNGILVARISAFNEPAGSMTADEIIAMAPRTWTVANNPKPDPGSFSAQLASAPANGATISGVITLEVTGSNIKNVELLPAEGYEPKYAVFAVSPDGTRATAALDTTSLPDGALTVRISAFDAPAGQPANEIVVMSARTWNIRNKPAPATFTARVTNAPADGATISGIVRLEVTGSGIENVELLPRVGYTPKLAIFSISPDKTKATVDFDTTKFSNGRLDVRISAFNKPAGDVTASEITAMPARTWFINNARWRIADLGTIGHDPVVSRMNDSSVVVGYGYTTDGFQNPHAFVSMDSTLTDIGTLGGAFSQAFSINNAGQTVGFSSLASGAVHAFIYQNGAMSDLGTPPGLEAFANGFISANDINDMGVILGRASNQGANMVFLLSNGVVTNLNSQLNGLEFYSPNHLNNAGQFLLTFGIRGNCNSFLYSGGMLTEIKLQVAPAPGTTLLCNLAADINNSGLVVGEASEGYAFTYKDGVYTKLGFFLGAKLTRPRAINDGGQIVGFVETEGVTRAFLYKDGSVVDLSNLPDIRAAGWTLESATAINSSGQIAGVGINRSGQRHVFLLTPPSAP